MPSGFALPDKPDSGTHKSFSPKTLPLIQRYWAYAHRSGKHVRLLAATNYRELNIGAVLNDVSASHR